MRALALVGVLAVLAPCASAASVTLHAGTAADGSLYFRPEEIKVMQGEKVTLTLVNDDSGTPHDWALLEYGGRDIEVYAKGGESRSITFTATQSGEYRIVCQVVGHKQAGMEGRFVVEEKSRLPAPLPLLPMLLAACLAPVLRRRLA